MKDQPLSAFASVIGYRAEELCRRSTTGNIIGVTSSGVFILGDRQRVLFLSLQNIPGPWTVLFSTPPSRLTNAMPGMQISFSDSSIHINDILLNINLSIADIWHTPALPDPVLPVHNIQTNIQKTITDYVAQKEPDGLALLLPHLLSTTSDVPGPDALQSTRDSLKKIRAALNAGNPEGVIDSCKPLIGQGRGLTPAGDDCISGIFLGLVRSRSDLFPDLELNRIKQEVIAYAFQHTTSLSASQIEAAAEGSADFRLLNALDGILTGNPKPKECARLLADYGHSSGGDALTGFYLTLVQSVS